MQVLLFTSMLPVALGSVLVADLLAFHIVLRIKGLVTYDYILATQGQSDPECCGLNIKFVPFVGSCDAMTRFNKAKISVCRALRTTAAEGQQARWRKQTGKVAPIQLDYVI
jgi:hypothetical protein